MMRTRAMVLLSACALLGLVGLVGLALAQAGTDRPDCPGKIICPLTGEPVCKDRCPLSGKASDDLGIDPNRPDCPGRIICPLTGEPVCKDRCPLGDKAPVEKPTGAKWCLCCVKKG